MLSSLRVARLRVAPPRVASPRVAAYRYSKLSVGDEAPDFCLPTHDGGVVQLSQHRGVRPVVLFFYAERPTSWCLDFLLVLRDFYPEVVTTGGAALYGVSHDDVQATHAQHVNLKLPYTLLSDFWGLTHRDYQVPNGWEFGRGTVVVDVQGRIAALRNSVEDSQRVLLHLGTVGEGLKRRGM
jgi:peroxiredoxin Q/BCP